MGDDSTSAASLDIAIRTSSDLAGATAASDAFDQVAGSAEKAAPAVDKLAETSHNLQGEQDGSLRTSRHFIEALIGISEGGPQAAAGVAMLTRIITELGGEVALGPLGPLVLVVSTLAAVGIPLLTKALGDTKDKTSDNKTETSEWSEAVSALKTTAGESYSSILQQLQAVSAEMQKQIEAARALQRAQDELKSARLAGQIAELDAEQTKESAGKDPDERAALQRQFDAKRLATRQGFERDQADQAVRDQQSAVERANAELEEKKKEADALQANIDRAQKTLQTGVPGLRSDTEFNQGEIKGLSDLSNQIDLTGAARGLDPAERKRLEDLRSKQPQLEDQERLSKGPSYESEKGLAQKDVEEYQKRLEKETDPSIYRSLEAAIANREARLKAIQEFEANKQAAAEEVTPAKIDNAQKAKSDIGPAETAVTTAETQLQTAQVKASTVGVTQGTAQLDLQQKQAGEVARQHMQATIDVLKRQVEDLQSQLKNPKLSDDQRAAIQQQVSNLEASEKERQLVYEKEYGQITPGAADVASAGVRGQVQGAQYDRDKADTKAGVKQPSFNPADIDAATQAVNRTVDYLNDGSSSGKEMIATIKQLPALLDRVGQAELDTADSLKSAVQNLHSQLDLIRQRLEDTRNRQ